MNQETGMSIELEKILAKSSLDPRLKKVLHDALGAIAQRQDTLARELKSAFEQERKTGRDIKNLDFTVRTALVEELRLKELEAFGYYEIPGKVSINRPLDFARVFRQIFFLSVPYDQFSPLCERRFRGKSSAGDFEYGFSPFYGYVEAEQKLDLLFRLYGFNSACPWSPWARRAIGIRVYGEPADDADLCLVENGLADIFLADRSIVWNMEFRTDEKSSAVRTMPRNGSIAWHYYYTICDDGLNLWPLPDEVIRGDVEPEEIDVVSRGDEFIILSCLKRFLTLSCQKIVLHADAEAPLEIFDNETRKGAPDFPASRGQLNRFLAGFAKGGFGCRLATTKGGKIIPRYQNGHRTGPAERQSLMKARRDALDVEFYCSAEPGIFLADYANWVLGELERSFPLFYWRGIYA